MTSTINQPPRIGGFIHVAPKKRHGHSLSYGPEAFVVIARVGGA
jgi:hypothetical protein